VKKKNIANVILLGLTGIAVVATIVVMGIKMGDMPKSMTELPELSIERATDIIVQDDVLIKAQSERTDNLIYLVVMLGDVIESSNLELGDKNVKAIEKMERRDRELLQLIIEYKHSREELMGEDKNVLDKQRNKK
jgi:hypothetical protein